MHRCLESVASSAAKNDTHFAQSHLAGIDFIDVDQQGFDTGNGQPALSCEAKNSWQGQPERKRNEQDGQQPESYNFV